MSVDFAKDGCAVGKIPQEFENAQIPVEFPVEMPVQQDDGGGGGGGCGCNESCANTATQTASSTNSTWNNLKNWINDGLKLLNEESLQFTVKFVVEFPSTRNDNCIENEKIESKAIVKENPPLPHNLTDMVPNLEYYPQKEEPELVKEVRRILAMSVPDSVELCSEGIGGTYFIRNEQGNRIAVFKPTDEEPGAENNPKGKIDDPLLPPGGGSIREVAAYILDHGFAGVPETYLVSGIVHPCFSSVKSGSLQKYISNTEDSDISSSRYSVEDVHKIGILDVRLYNMDRNAENLLIQNLSSPKLIPIDHSYVLPHELSFLWFEWLHWKQAKQPFSEEILSYIQSIDIKKDAETLRQLGFERPAIRTMMISSTLLKTSALKYGYNLTQIGTLMSRKSIKDQSALEKMVKKTEEKLTTEKIDPESEEGFMEALVRIIEEELSSSSSNSTISQNNLKKTK